MSCSQTINQHSTSVLSVQCKVGGGDYNGEESNLLVSAPWRERISASLGLFQLDGWFTPWVIQVLLSPYQGRKQDLSRNDILPLSHSAGPGFCELVVIQECEMPSRFRQGSLLNSCHACTLNITRSPPSAAAERLLFSLLYLLPFCGFSTLCLLCIMKYRDALKYIPHHMIGFGSRTQSYPAYQH